MSKAEEFNDKIHKATQLLYEVSKEWDEDLVSNFPKINLDFDELICALGAVEFKEKPKSPCIIALEKQAHINKLFNKVMQTISCIGYVLNDDQIYAKEGKSYVFNTERDMLEYIYDQASNLVDEEVINFDAFTNEQIDDMIKQGKCTEFDVVNYYRNEQWRDIP